MTSTKLPALRLLLLPPFAVFAYSAFCYYREEYREGKGKEDQSMKIIKYMLQNSDKANNSGELQVAYQKMSRYTSMMITDPSQRIKKVINSKMEKIENRGFWSSRFQMIKDIQDNNFNQQRIIKEGIFAAGFWVNISQTHLHKIDHFSSFEKFLKKAVRNRQRRCSQIANLYAGALQRGYHQVYEECISKTQEPIAQMKRELDLIQKMQLYQAGF